MSQQAPSSQKMDRAASNLSTRSAGPFTGNTPVSPLVTFQTPGLQGEYGEQGHCLPDGGLISPQNLSSLLQQIPADEQLHEISTLPDMGAFSSSPAGILVDPADWLAAHEASSPELVAPFHTRPHRSLADVVANSNTGGSVCGSMTSGPTYDTTAPMTRENSQFDTQSHVGGMSMVHTSSQKSQRQDTYFPECSQPDADYGYTSSFFGKNPSHESTLFAVGSKLATLPGQHYALTAPNDGLLVTPNMERSLSSTSAKSTTSLSARAKDTLKQQNHRAQNAPLMPKPSGDESKAEPPSDETTDGKAAITKTKYVRPKQPKVFCELCDEHGEGFRGEHELRRHKDRKHQMLVKMFICVDPQELGLPVNVQVVNPLSKCKACKAQKKYGAYYNAAAHLRRTHFKEKPSRSKNKASGANGGDDDKRGGKGGGDWPSMLELRNWMRELYVPQDEQRSKDDDDADDELDNGQPFFGETELNPSGVGSSSSDLASAGMAHVDYGFQNPLTINTINTDMAYMDTRPLPADFPYTNMPLAYGADVAAFSTMDHMHPPSTTSSSAMVTPLTMFNDAQPHHFENVGYQYTA